MYKHFGFFLLYMLVFLPAGCEFKFEEEFSPPRYEVFFLESGIEAPVTGDSADISTALSVGATSSCTIIVQNTGKAYLEIRSFTVLSATAGEFTLGDVTGEGSRLDVGERASAEIIFAPTVSGIRTCSIVITSDAPEYTTKTITVNWTAF